MFYTVLKAYSVIFVLFPIGIHDETDRSVRFLISLLFTAALVFLNQYITLFTSNSLRPLRESSAFNSRTYSSTYCTKIMQIFKLNNSKVFLCNFL